MEIIKVELPTSLKAAGHIPHFENEWNPHRHYLAAIEEGQIVGLVCFNWQPGWLENAFGIGYVSVAEAFRGRGVATALTDAFFALAAKEHRGVFVTAYEPDGKRYLRKLIQRAASRHQVSYVERDYLT